MSTDERGQLSRADLATMSPAEIAAAQRAGRCARLLGVPTETVDTIARAQAGATLDRDDVRELWRLGRADLIEAARVAGNIATPGGRARATRHPAPTPGGDAA